MKKKSKQIKPYQEVKEPQIEYFAFKDIDVHELANKILKAIGDDKQKRAILLGLLVSDVATKQEFTAILAELKAMRKASDEKFEVMDKRFEASERRFEAIESELKAMREESERRFEAIDKRFENQREDFHLYLKASIEALNKSLTNKISALGSRWGIMAEDTFTVALKEILSKAGFVVTKWRKTDSNAEFFLKPRDAEIDILIKNGKRIAVEIKSTINIGDIEIFEKTVLFYEKSESVKIDEKFMVGIHLRKEVDEYASKLGIKLLSQVEDIIE